MNFSDRQCNFPPKIKFLLETEILTKNKILTEKCTIDQKIDVWPKK